MSKRSNRRKRNIAKSRFARLSVRKVFGRRIVELDVADRYGRRTLAFSEDRDGYFVREIESEVPVVVTTRHRGTTELKVKCHTKPGRLPVHCNATHTVRVHRSFPGTVREVYHHSETTTRKQRFAYSPSQFSAFLAEYGCSL